MTETEFFTLLENLSIEQLTQVHEKIINKINKKQPALLKLPQTKGYTLPKIPPNNININDMAENLDIDVTLLMREISKH